MSSPRSQRSRFVAGEADAFFHRNKGQGQARVSEDPVLRALAKLGVRAERSVEIGAGEGWRMQALVEEERTQTALALEPSGAAVSHGRGQFARVAFARATGDALPLAAASIDLVVLGFFLYLVDRRDLFRVASEVDRVLRDGGHIAILDFFADRPYRKPYAHAAGLYAYKQDYSQLFAWNPLYRLVLHEVSTHPGGDQNEADDRIAVSILARDDARGYADGPDAGAATSTAQQAKGSE